MVKDNRFLNKPRIMPKISKTSDVDVFDLINFYSNSGAYNGGRLVEACKIFENMIQQDATICLTLAGALTPAGIGGFISKLIEKGLIDFIISITKTIGFSQAFRDLPGYR